MTPGKVNKVVEMIDLPSDCWASINNIVTNVLDENLDDFKSPGDVLDQIEEQLNSLIDEAIDVLSNLREKRAEILKAVAD